MRDRKGAILVTTSWILALLTLLALGIGIRMGIDIKLMNFFLNSSKAHYLAEAGLRKVMILLQVDDDRKVDSLNEVWGCGVDFSGGIGFGEGEDVLKNIELGEGTFTIGYEYGKDMEGKPIYVYGASDEEGKLNINAIDGKLLSELPNFTAGMVAAILDWRDTNDIKRAEGAESDHYEKLDNPYKCKNGLFSVPEELLLVKDIKPEIYDAVKDIITAYPPDGDGKVNINTAPEGVLAVLIGSDFPELPGKIVSYRDGKDEIPGTYDDKIFTKTSTIVSDLDSYPLVTRLEDGERDYLNDLIMKKKYFKVNSNTFRIISQGRVRGGRVKKTIQAVVKRAKRNDEPPEILYYYED